MKTDFTRNTFSPLKHFTRVLMQQGRVQLDADWNEQAAILLRYLQVLAADLIGPHGGPSDNWGFAISALQTTPSVSDDFRIGLGHYYVDGILCEVDSTSVPLVVPAGATGNVVQVQAWTVDGVQFQPNQYVELFDDVQPPSSPAFAPALVQIKNPDQAHRTLTLQGAPAKLQNATAPKIRHIVTYMTQSDYPVPSDGKLGSGTYQVYLDVWERQITYVEDDSIREVALGGPDTAARAKVVWQVKVTQPDTEGCLTTQQLKDRFQWEAAGRLKAMAKQDSKSTDPCIVPHDAHYRGAENQLYRVEIHRPGSAWDGRDTGKTGAATFKWSRENGSVIFPIVAGGGTNTVTLENLGRDDHLSLAEGDWVEVQDDDYVLLQNRAGNLLQVQSIDRTTMTATLSGAPDPNVGNDPSRHPLLRRWDHKEGDSAEGGLQLGSDGAALIVEDSDGSWLLLEDGVQIQFQKPDQGEPANQYRTDDYWLIPARTAIGNVEWPTEPAKDSSGNPVTVPIALPPAGVQHHYAPLAVITLDASGLTITHYCRYKFDAQAKPMTSS